MKNLAKAIADGINILGWNTDVPNENGEMKFSPECHEVQTILIEIKKVVESWPVVYRSQIIECDDWSNQKMAGHTQKARLAFIEPIVKEPCNHDPNLLNQKIGGWFCKHCGIELVAEWREK